MPQPYRQGTALILETGRVIFCVAHGEDRKHGEGLADAWRRAWFPSDQLWDSARLPITDVGESWTHWLLGAGGLYFHERAYGGRSVWLACAADPAVVGYCDPVAILELSDEEAETLSQVSGLPLLYVRVPPPR